MRRHVTALAFACALSGCGGKPTATDSRPASPSVPIATARVGTILERIVAQGRVGLPSGSSAKLAFAQSGTLRRIGVRVGETVAAGESVAELDRAALAAPLAQARADASVAEADYGGGGVPAAAERGANAKLVAARARQRLLERGTPSASDGRTEAAAALRQATLKVGGDEAALERAHALFAAGTVARKEVEAADRQLESDRADLVAADAKVSASASDYDSALVQARADVIAASYDLRSTEAQKAALKGQVRSANARVDSARVAYDAGVLAAPQDGVVLSISKHVGEYVDPSTSVMEIGPRSSDRVTITVPATAASRIAIADRVTYSTSPTGGTLGNGRILAVVPVVDRTQAATVIASGVMPGSIEGGSLTVTIALGRVRGIAIPNSAIVEDPQTGDTLVFVRVAHAPIRTSNFAMRPVRLGVSDGSRTIVERGLQAGERFATSGGYMLLAPTGD